MEKITIHLTKQDYLRVLLPTKREVWVVIALTIVVFLVFEGNLIFFLATNSFMLLDTELQESFSGQISAVFENNEIANKASLIVFWAGVGLVAYSIIWSLYSFISEGKEEIIVEAQYLNQASKKEQLQRALVQAGLLAGIIALGLASINVTVPYITNLWTDAIMLINEETISAILQIVAGFIGLAINFYLFKVLIDWIEILE